MELFLDMESKLGEMDTRNMIDLLGELRRVKSMLERREKQVGEVLKAAVQDQLNNLTPETPEIILTGFHRQMQAVRVWQKRLDTEGLKAEYGEQWYEEHCKVIDFTQFKFPKGEKGAGTQ